MTEPGDPRLEEAIRALRRKSAPAGWQARVWAAIERGEPRRSTTRKWWWSAAAAVAVAAALLFVLRRPPHREPSLALATRIEKGPLAVRGEAANVGDTWVIEATVEGARSWEIRAYSDDRIAGSCGPGVCRVVQGRAQLVLPLRTAGTYRVLVLAADTLPKTVGDLDGDVAAATRAKARTKLSTALDVRPTSR